MRHATLLLCVLLVVGCAARAPAGSLAGLPRASAYDTGLEPSRLAAFLARARQEHSSALIIAHRGQVVFAEGAIERPTFAMSVSKSVTALVLGTLVDAGHLDLDAPLGTGLVPEWSDDARGALTVRHLLTHSSGLDPTRWTPDGPHATVEAHGLAAALVAEPDTAFAYNNQVADFLAVLAQRAHPHHVPLDDQLTSGLGLALGFAGEWWRKDPAGTPRAAGEWMVRPIDLLAIGQLVLDRGRVGDEQLVSEAWIDTLATPSSTWAGCGHLWWRDHTADGALMLRADGYLGQFVAVVPDEQLVVVRVRDPREEGWSADEYGWPGYIDDVFALVGRGEAVRW
jgi:CubicO group peptidase (beta-lactamase class C family)